MIVDGFEWEKFTTPQTLTSGAGGFGGVTITDWETTPNIDSSNPELSGGFDPVTGIFTPAESGWYQIGFQVQFEAGDTGYRKALCSIVHAELIVPTAGSGITTRLSMQNSTYLDGPENEHERFFTASISAQHNQGSDLDIVYAAFHLMRFA